LFAASGDRSSSSTERKRGSPIAGANGSDPQVDIQRGGRQPCLPQRSKPISAILVVQRVETPDLNGVDDPVCAVLIVSGLGQLVQSCSLLIAPVRIHTQRSIVRASRRPVRVYLIPASLMFPNERSQNVLRRSLCGSI
jgi:hypothetical protein